MKQLHSELKKAKEAIGLRDFTAASACLDNISGAPYLPSEYFLIKSRLIQLTDDSKCSHYTLQDALDCLIRAETIEPNNVNVLLDLGFFYSRVMVNEAKAFTAIL